MAKLPAITNDKNNSQKQNKNIQAYEAVPRLNDQKCSMMA